MDTGKKDSGILVIFIILLLGAVGYLGYDKYMSMNKTDNEPTTNPEPQTTSTKKTSDEKYKTDNEPTTNPEPQVISSEKSSDERYKEYLNNLKSSIQSKLKGEHGDLDEQLIVLSITSLIGNEYLNFVIDKDLNLKENNQVLDTNVLNMFVSNSGNGGYKTLYYIKEDGKIYYIRITPQAEIVKQDSNVKENKCKNITNIINIANMVSNSTLFIDVDGKIYTTSDCYPN